MSQMENTTVASGSEPGLIGEFPCTQTQLRCWVLDQLKPGNPALNVAVRWEIRGTFKASTIEAAFRRIIQRHEVLRTRFVERAGQPYQQVVEAVDFRMSVIDLRNMPAAQREQRILSIGEETASAPFDLGKPCLFRVTLLMVENDRAFILITAHQSCFDGWSIRVLGREVGEIAAAIDAGRQPVLPELPLQYGDFALWQDEYLGSYGFETEKTFWKEQLGGAPYFEVPTDHPRQAIKTNNGNILSVVMPPEFSERIEKAAREHRVSLYSYGAALMSAMLHRFTGERDVLFGTQIAGRDHSDLEDMIGVFINNLVLRFPVAPEASFSEHIQATSGTVTAALNHQRMPFNKLVEALNPVRDPSRNPLISVNFNLQKAFLEDRRYGDFELISAPSQSPGVIYDLSFIMIGRPSGWRMSIEYNTDLFDRSTIESLLQLWQDIYELALVHPEAPLSALRVPGRNAETAGSAADTPVIELSRFRQGETDPGDMPLPGDSSTMSAAQRMKALSGIWAEVLNLKTVEPESDFFALGGHSLLALRMLSAVRERFGVKADLALLFKEPKLKGFAQALFGEDEDEKGESPRRSPWEMSVYKTGTGPCSVYTLNHPFLYYRLANELDDSISVYNVNMFSAAQDQSSAGASLKDIAGQAIEVMQIGERRGPIVIVGLCVNGVLAIEVARQLREAGADVAFSAIIDSWAPGYFRSLPKSSQRWWNTERRIKRLGYFTGKLLSGRMRLMVYLKEFNLTLNLMQKLGIGGASYTPEETSNAVVTDLLVQAARDYRPEKGGATLLFRSQANHPRAGRLRFGWGEAVGENAEVVDLDGWHEDSLTMDGIRTLASSVENKLLAERA
ncbi:condensation domain-containing protein [Rhizobium cremeum]|uniref:condensation domain-containing protein n=1 Tax=Rhizobium cremeum TaxID=2813827 RepID=UPI000DDD8924